MNLTRKQVVTHLLVFLILTILSKTKVSAQQFLTTIDGWNAYVHLPDDYNTTTQKYPVILFVPGLGEVGTDASKLLVYGPSRFVDQGHNMQFTVNGVLEKPIVISIQPISGWPQGNLLNRKIDSIYARWRCDTNRLAVTGLSMGGWSWDNYVCTNMTYTRRPAAIVAMSAPPPDYPMANMANFANDGGKWWGFEGTLDYRQMDLIRDIMNNAVPGSARYTQYVGGHCCWNTWYNPTWTENGESIYTWMLRQSQPAGPQNISPVAIAGVDTTITLPANTAILRSTATDVDGTISSYLWTKISGPTQFTIATPNAAQSNVNNLVQGIYKFEIRATDNNGAIGRDTMTVTVNSTSSTSNVAPVAEAGNTQLIYLPLNSVTLNGTGSTDADGLIVGYNWQKVSGPAAGLIVTPNAAVTVVSGLAQGSYKFRLTVTDNNGATGIDSVIVTVNAANPLCNQNAPQVFTLNTTSPGEVYMPNTAGNQGWKGGDTVRIPAGNYNLIDLGNFRGDPCRPIVITNYGGRVTVKAMRFGNDAAYFKLTGTGHPSYTYGIKVDGNGNAGVGIGMAHHVEINNIEVTGPEVGFFFKKNPEAGNVNSQYPNYVMTKFYIHHNYLHNIHGEGMYIGHTYPNADPYSGNLVPIRMDSVEIAYNIVDSTDWDGIQLSNARFGAKIHHNTVTNFGLINMGSQQAGIILGGNTNGDIYNNIVKKGTGNGIEAFGYGLIRIYNNDVDSSGRDGTINGQESVYCNDPINGIEVNPVQTIQFYNNTIRNPQRKGAVRVAAYQNNSGPAQVIDNQYCIPNAPSNWQSIYIAVNPAGSVVQNNTLMSNCSAPPNIAPVANAGNNITISYPVNSTTLNGSGTDADGTITTYLWTKISGPAQFTIVTPTSASTIVNNLVPGSYQFQLQVTDNNGASDRDTVQVIVNGLPNILPLANAGADGDITWPVNNAPLNGSGTDPDGTITSYLWSKHSGPTQFTITNPNAAQTTVTNLAQGTYQFVLRVTDNNGGTGTDTMSIVVNAGPPPPNVPPVANAGSNISITLPQNSASLNGSGSDVDGTISGYTWTKISGPAQFNIVNPSSAQTTVNNLVQGIYQFRLVVTDNIGATDDDTIQVTVNAAPANIPPVANAGNDVSVTLPQNSASLNGSGTDADGSITTYNWTKIAGPTQFLISNPNSAQTSVNNLVQGVYRFRLLVTDNNGATGADTVTVTVNAALPPNTPPVANAGTNINLTLPINNTTLTGSGTDADGTVVSYMWAKVSGPASCTFGTQYQQQTTISNLTEGIYAFELRVIDNSGSSGRDTVLVVVNPPFNQKPLVNAGIDKEIILPINNTMLEGVASDPDGTIASYKWTQVSGPIPATFANSNAAQTEVSRLAHGVYQFELSATDNRGGVSSDTMTVFVKSIPVSTASAYPNPVNNILSIYIDANTTANLTSVRIYDVTGVVVYTEMFMRSQRTMVKEVNVSTLPNGVYIVEVMADINTKTAIKVIKQ